MEQPNKENSINLLETFLENQVNVSETTKNDYNVKLKSLQRQMPLDGDEDDWLEFCKQIENPNTRSNKTNALIQLRSYHDLPCRKLQDLKEYTRKDITQHRKLKARDNLATMMSYDELIAEVDKLHGSKYYMNHMFAHHGLRVKDVNCQYRRRLKPGEVLLENTIVFNPDAKNPKMTMHVVQYKTAKTYGTKVIHLSDNRLFQELRSLNLKNKQYIFATKSMHKPSCNYMNVKSCADSVNKYGEGKISKILVKHLIDTAQHDKVAELSKSRGTALSTLYSHYNVYDNLPDF
tara:strand:- start:1859 stop:2731 length:873 start_codon:yes stop_codon:yes gene_type:complete